ncbi:MAG: peptidylprolyl isomerase [Paracoccus denitrificans]|nr:MAG: peptidylprolyl isomerase [Paracoccus denitrificans]PZO83455.1 MAG: peptidylprolyl isomerase [Paracoccus denitrificans]
MMRKVLVAAALMAATTAGAAFAQGATDGPGPNLVIDVADATGASKGQIVLDLYPDKAPKHVERLVTLAKEGAYDGVVFHRVIDGFMAQTGDVEHGKQGGDTSMAGMGGSQLPDLKAEFTDTPFTTGTVGMARSQSPDSANSQFFIDLAPAEFLNGQYTVVGQLIKGEDVLQSIKKGAQAANGAVDKPDYMSKVTVVE